MSVCKRCIFSLGISVIGILVFSVSAFAYDVNPYLNSDTFEPLPVVDRVYDNVPSSDGVYYFNLTVPDNSIGFVCLNNYDEVMIVYRYFNSVSDTFYDDSMVLPCYCWFWSGNSIPMMSWYTQGQSATDIAIGGGTRVYRQNGYNRVDGGNGNLSVGSSFTSFFNWNFQNEGSINYFKKLVPFSTLYDSVNHGFVVLGLDYMQNSGITIPTPQGPRDSIALNSWDDDLFYYFETSSGNPVTNVISSDNNIASSIIGSSIGSLIPEYDQNGNLVNIITNNTFEFDITPFTESDGNQPDPWDNSAIDDYNSSNDDVQDSISDFKGQFAFSDVFGEDFDLTSFRGAMTFWKDRFDEVMDFNPVFPVVITTSLTLGLVAVILGRKLGVG